ncbi:sugar phosphate isomerase/epimerase family protein [Loktanella sp. Alg231-35]|uniref:sugar phosphate isomerase/epimerase family protein n=1 Tax=Loktanella sp. Alg231-35 TaxID=1922220 RepID=UPI001F2FC391|nr:sugar phosphate isomerase/epimerase family protein [Loktanella sp. Alg231-35]
MVDRLAVYAALMDHGFDGLEIAPGLFFFDALDSFAPDQETFDRAMDEIADAGLSLVSMQALLFGVDGAALFDGDAPLQRLEEGMERAIQLAGRMGIPNLVFGAPKQRIVPEGMSTEDATECAADVFRRLGDIALTHGTKIAIEANPATYGTNFLTHGDQALGFVRKTDHPAISFILDVGAMQINDEFAQIPALSAEAGALLSHVHFSEPDLGPAPASLVEASTVLTALVRSKYDSAVSIEMRATSDPVVDIVAAIKRLAQSRDAALQNEYPG